MSGTTQRMTDNELTTIAKTIAKKHGYTDATASFIVVRDAKVRWTRTYQWISLEVADYFAALDAETVAAILEEIFRRIEDRRADATAYENAVLSKEFRDANIAAYLRRSQACPVGAEGVPDVQAAYERLCRRGMLKRDPELTLCWTDRVGDIAARSSAIFKTVVFSNRLARIVLSDEDLDFLVYGAVIRATRTGLSPADGEHATELTESYPDAMTHMRTFEEQGIRAF